ncbi:MAG TPA: response regulator [Pyrinomonadaceae bacterium]|jgi:signal transduction histidine kinase
MPKVLLVDDEPNIRWTMAEFLKRAGYDPLTASDVESALAILDQTRVDAALIDIILPRKSGIELLKELRSRDMTVPVIMITGEPNVAQLPEIVRAGAYDFIAKPVTKDALIKAVSRAVEKKHLDDERRRLEQEVKEYAEQLEARVAERTEELRAAQAQLIHQEKIAALGRAAAQVAHEIKNPLAGLRLYSLHLKTKVAGKLSESEMSLIDKTIDSINRLLDTADQILSFARPINLVPARVDLNSTVTSVVQLLEPQITTNGIEVRLELASAAGCAMLDEASIHAALMNLMLNAIQSMAEGGSLTVTTEWRGDVLRLTISDTGGGMTEEQAGNVFEPFYTTKSQGLGLGAPYARKVIEEHRGTITLQSRVGGGTSVEIELPVGE